MARTLQFQLNGKESVAAVNKVDRKKLYGWVERIPVDRHGNECFLGSISSDGMQIFGRESFELGYVTAGGEWLPKSEIIYIDEHNQPIPEAESSFNTIIPLSDTISIDDFLLHTITSVYHLTGDNIGELLESVQSQPEVYVFDFSYTRSYSSDPAFLIENDNHLFLLVGKAKDFGYIGLEESEDLPEEDESGDEDQELDDSLDFSMM